MKQKIHKRITSISKDGMSYITYKAALLQAEQFFPDNQKKQGKYMRELIQKCREEGYPV